MTLFERIELLAKKRDKTLKDISLELGYSKNYLYTLKKQSPKADNLKAIAEYFRVSTDYLLGNTDNPNQISENSSKEVDVSDDTVIMTYGGKPLSDADRQIVLAATRALVEQRAKEKEEKEKK